MRIPETPSQVSELDLMQRLAKYANGSASWESEVAAGPEGKKACQVLYADVISLVDKVLAPILDRINSREMDVFTMHDRKHGLKVAHLMWHILDPDRRELLTPPEVALLVLTAHFHDIGMALSREEREERLGPNSDLWEKLELDPATLMRMETLRAEIASGQDRGSHEAKLELGQMEEALLTSDTRERHATRARYEKILSSLRQYNQQDPQSIPDIDRCLSFDGNSFQKKLIDICVSHNEDAESLVRRDSESPELPRFPRNYPVGATTADLQMVAAALRLADILDFDRERTPHAIFYYLIPSSWTPEDNKSVLEWRKHMAISHWNIEHDAIVFRARCNSHIVHHAIVLFCASIQNEVISTRATFGALAGEVVWPFALPDIVKNEIHEEGYHYVPYRFELDDERIYQLLMGGAIYENPLVAVRELIQNAVDACKLRDALTQLYEPFTPSKENRIFVTYEESTGPHDLPILRVLDTGTGMDDFVLARYFLKVGQSYYNSLEFKRDLVELRRNNLDFAPVSEFGIGFLSCFLLADRVEVETAMWESPRGDTDKRTLIIDGPTRLIRLKQEPNEGSKRFKGTQVSLHIRRTPANQVNPEQIWIGIREYLQEVCKELPYRLNLQHKSFGTSHQTYIDASPADLKIPPHLDPAVLRVPVQDDEFGLDGEIGLVNLPIATEIERRMFEGKPLALGSEKEALAERFGLRYGHDNPESELLRGGFKIGGVPGLPRPYIDRTMSYAKIRLTWASRRERRYISPNLARNAISSDAQLEEQIARIWLTFMIENIDKLTEGQLHHVRWESWSRKIWLERFSAYDVYRLARLEWEYGFKGTNWETSIADWEMGRIDRIWLNHEYDLSSRLLEMVLPRISTLILEEDGHRFVSRPINKWKQILTDCHDFVSHPIKWDIFVTYGKSIKNLLYYAYPGFESLNDLYRDKFVHFGEANLKVLVDLLYHISRAWKEYRVMKLSPAEGDILRTAANISGNLLIGSTGGARWPLSKFAPSD